MSLEQNESLTLRQEILELKDLVTRMSPRRGPLLFIDDTAVVDPSCTLLTGTNSNRITIGRHTKVFRGAEWLGTITVGDRVFINSYSFIRPNVVIEDDVSLGQHVRLVSDTHEISTGARRTGAPRHDPIRIGAGTWVGTGVTIIGGVSIGKRCVIAAGAVVVGDIPSNSVAAGVPAKIIRQIDDIDGKAVLSHIGRPYEKNDSALPRKWKGTTHLTLGVKSPRASRVLRRRSKEHDF